MNQQLGFGNSLRPKRVFVGKESGCLWYCWDGEKQQPIPIAEKSLTGYLRGIETIEHTSDIPDYSYGAGEFDGSIGLEAQYPNNNEYYSGWSQGHREYLQKENNVSYNSDNLDEIPF